MLEREGYEVFVAVDGRQASEYIDNNAPPDIVLMDLMLPYVDGFELILRIRERSQWKDVPVITISARTLEKDEVRALDAGANDFVAKPYNPRVLLARIKRFVSA